MILTRTRQLIWGTGIALPVALLTVVLARVSGFIPARTPIDYARQHNPNLTLNTFDTLPYLQSTDEEDSPPVEEVSTPATNPNGESTSPKTTEPEPVVIAPPTIAGTEPAAVQDTPPAEAETSDEEESTGEVAPEEAASQPETPSVPPWRTAYCEKKREAVLKARSSGNFSEVLRQLKSSCWENRTDYLYYKVLAYSELRQFDRCVTTGRSSSRSDIRQLVKKCEFRLKQE